MKLPAGKDERIPILRKLVEDCRASMSRRRDFYELRRRLYLWGSEMTPSPVNKCQAHIDMLAAILYSGDAARLTIDLPTGADQKVVKRAPAVRKRMNEIFKDTHLDVIFGQGVLWSLVYDSMFIKFVPRKEGFTPYLVEPGTLGVLREDLPSLDAQEAFIHEYYISKTELETRLNGNPKKDEILKLVSAEVKKQPQMDAGPIQAIATSVAYAGNITGYTMSTSMPDDYEPELGIDLVKMTDLWVQDDDAKDYRTVVYAGDAYVLLYDGMNLFLPQMHAFSQICPNPMYSYFWGESECARLRLLQRWRNERSDQIRVLLDLAVNPPAAFSGFPMVDEKKFGTRVPGGIITSQMPSSKVDVLRPDLPQDVFAEISRIDDMFDDASGMTGTLQGSGAGTKTRGHAEMMAQFGSLRPRKKALIVEDCLDAVATKMLKVAQAYITEMVATDDGDHFTLAEFPDDVVVRSDGHSQSPVFSSQTRETAIELFKLKAIDRESLIQMMNPPGVEELLLRLKTIEQMEAQQQAQDLELEKEKIAHGRSR